MSAHHHRTFLAACFRNRPAKPLGRPLLVLTVIDQYPVLNSRTRCSERKPGDGRQPAGTDQDPSQTARLYQPGSADRGHSLGSSNNLRRVQQTRKSFSTDISGRFSCAPACVQTSRRRSSDIAINSFMPPVSDQPACGLFRRSSPGRT